MPFFGPGGLGSTKSEPGLDPQLLDALMQQFPGLAQMGQGQQQPNALQGYQWAGPQFFPGQGQGGFGNLSPFEGAKGFGSESITAGLALGNYGKSSSQQPAGAAAQPFSLGALSLPTLALPQAVASQQGGFGDGTGVAGAPGGEQSGGITIGAGDVLDATGQIAGLFNQGTGTAFDPTGQTQTPAAQQQRAGERVDYSNATGSPSGIPLAQTLSQFGQAAGLTNPGVQPAPTSAPPGFDGASFTLGDQTAPLSPGGFQPTSFSMPGQGETMTAPGGSAQTALGPAASDGGISSLFSAGNFGSATDLLSGLYGLYSGVQNKDPQSALLSTLQAYQGLQPLFNQVAGSNVLPSTGEAGMKVLENIAPDLAASLSGQIAGMTAAESAAALGELGINTAQGGLSGLAGGASAGGIGALVSAALQQVMAATGARPGDMQSAKQQLAPILMGLAGAAGPAGPVIAALASLYEIGDYISNADAAKSGAVNNPIMGQLYSDSTAGVAGANQSLDELFAGGTLSDKDTLALLNSLPGVVDSLLPYYSTGQGGVKALRASDTAGSPGMQSKDEYTQNFFNAQGRVSELVKELMNRGVSYEQLGQLAVNPMWASMGLDAGGRPEEFYARGRDQYAASAPHWSELAQSSQVITRGQNVDPSAPGYEAKVAWDEADRYQPEYSIRAPENMFFNDQGFSPHVGSQSFTPWAYAGGGVNGSKLEMSAFSPDNAFLAAMGAAGYDPDAISPQERLVGGQQPDASALQGVSSMYGGPLWAAMARMGQNDFTPMIQEKFNPWATWSGMSPDARLQAMGPSVLGPMQMNKDMGVYGGAWGEALNPRLSDTFGGGSGVPSAQALPAGGGFRPTWQGGPLDLGAMAQQQDPMLQQLQQFMQQLQGVQGGLPQLTQGLQQQVGAGLDPGVMAALQSSGFAPGGNTGGGGVDLQALLRQMGLAA